ncbi:hypothetical protein DAI22_02g292600 [Oryza sativa Japonica Group]|nr:hypothetical protein DAI22_02g292600 [Oryza sativa Japonica Group]
MGQTVKFGRVPFKVGFSHSQSRPKDRWQGKSSEQRSIESYNKIPEFPNCHKLEEPEDNQQTALLLSGSQNLSSPDIFQLLSVDSTTACFGNGAFDQGKDAQGKHEENSVHNVNQEIKQTMDGIRMTVGGVAEFLKSKLANMVQRGCGRKREDIRLQTAQMHAALSVARLATAVARMVGNCQSESTNANNTIMTAIGKDEHRKMHVAIASAAALVAASCSEAAKLTGASREQISTVIHMGMETRSLGDLLMLTTSAATCLKGANAFKMRNRAISNYAFENLMSNQKDVRLPIRTPDGKIHIRMVSVHCKHDKIILNLGKEHSLRTSKEYIIFDEHGGTTDFSYPTDEHSYHAINLATSGGNIQLLFEEHEQYSAWKSFIRYLIINKRSRLSY